MKKLLTGMTGVLLTVSLLAGCGGAKPTEPAKTPAAAESKTPTLDKIKKDGKLVIGTSPDYPPFESLDKDNKVVGFDIDLMNAVATKLGVKLEVVQMDFGGLIAALTTAKKFDVMAAGVSVTDERKQAVDFSQPYLIGKDAIIVHKDLAGKINGLADLKGKKVAVQLGTVQADAAKAVEGANVKEYNLFTEAAAAVSAKQADAVYLHSAVAKSFVAADKNLVLAAEVPSKDTAFALRKDTADLTATVNETIAELQKNGEFDKLVQKWFK